MGRSGPGFGRGGFALDRNSPPKSRWPEKTTIGIGGAARLYAEPAHEEDLRALVGSGPRRRRAPSSCSRRGSNLIVPDEGIDALVVSLRQPAWAAFDLRPDGSVWAGAGLRLKNLCGLAVKAGLAGFEFLEGIPGNLGGALRMNAGAMGGWIFDLVEEVRVMQVDGTVLTLAKSELHAGYRHCVELRDAIALGAVLRPAARSASAEIGRRIDVYRDQRQESQPQGRRAPAASSRIRRPPRGRLIDASGLKGERVGDAEVSSVHAQFHRQPGPRFGRRCDRVGPPDQGSGGKGPGRPLGAGSPALREELGGRAVSAPAPIVAVLAGGTSAEREVSLGSGRACALALARAHPVVLLEVSANALPPGPDPRRQVGVLHAAWHFWRGRRDAAIAGGGGHFVFGLRCDRQRAHDGQVANETAGRRARGAGGARGLFFGGSTNPRPMSIRAAA